MSAVLDALWVAGAHADRVPVADRERVAEHFRSRLSSDGSLVIHTCHRVEVVGSAPDAAAVLRDVPMAAALRLHRGPEAVSHVLRLATGLDSAVIGEDQILGQLRAAFAAAGSLAPEVRRLAEMALAAGREARAGQGVGRRDLADPALDWLVERGVSLAGARILVVGAGTLGGRLADAAHRRGASGIVASRDVARARVLAERHAWQATDLAGASALAAGVDGIAVALAGPWLEARRSPGLAPLIDLSAPPAVPPDVRRRLGGMFGDVDQLFPGVQAHGPRARAGSAPDANDRGSQPLVDAYVTRAEEIVGVWAERYERWLCGRAAVPTLCSLRERSEERRRVALERLLRRLPDLDERQRELIGTFSRQLTAALLHEPSARLREDGDGSAARAAGELFDLPR